MTTHPDPTPDAASPERTPRTIQEWAEELHSFAREVIAMLQAAQNDIRSCRAVIAERDAEIGRLKATHAEAIRALRAIRNHPVSDNKSRQRWRDAAIAMLAGEAVPDER